MKMSLKTAYIVVILLILSAAGSRAAVKPDTTKKTASAKITNEAGYVSAFIDGHKLFAYKYENVPFKPYIKELYTPSGTNILLDSPADHVHHHALMFALSADGVGFWEERPASGKQTHTNSISTSTFIDDSKKTCEFSGDLNWIDPKTEKTLLVEARKVTVTIPTGSEAVLLTWQSKLKPASGKDKVTLSGAHYYGLGMRFIRSMDTGGTFFNADKKPGKIFRGSERLARSTWCAYTAKANQKDVTVAMFDAPGNIRHPATWFTMTKPFAYLSATASWHTDTLELKANEPLCLRYGVAVWDEKVEPQQVEALYRQWLKTLKKNDKTNKEKK